MAKSHKDLLLEAHKEQQNTVNERRAQLLGALDELDEIKGKDDYVSGIEAVLAQYPQGISLAKIRLVFPDSEMLKEARKELKQNGVLEEKENKKSITFHLVSKN